MRKLSTKLSEQGKAKAGWDELNIDTSIAQKLVSYHQSSAWKELGRTLAMVPDENRLCGAEINSIATLIRRDRVELRRIEFLVSDTPEGGYVGEILRAYYSHRSQELGLDGVEYRRIADLQNERPWDFRTKGLRNLVREIGRIVSDIGEPTCVAIDATGGYKAQIAVAAIIGVALNIDVYYRHDEFKDDIISFPPLPVSLNYDLIGRYGRLLSMLEDEKTVADDDLGPVDEAVLSLLDEEIIDGTRYWDLSPIGQIYLVGFRNRYPRRSVDLRDALDTERKEPTFPDHHYPDDFKEFVRKVWLEFGWITRCVSKDYGKQAGIKRTGFDLVQTGDGPHQWAIVGTYLDKDCFGGRFEVLTTATRHQDLVWVVDQLNRRFGKPRL